MYIFVKKLLYIILLETPYDFLFVHSTHTSFSNFQYIK